MNVNKMLKPVLCIFMCAMIFTNTSVSCFAADNSNATGHKATVTARLLNGRMTPSKGAMKTAFFDRGDVIELTGWWSDDRNWVEVYAGEAGACWVARPYISERTESFIVINQDYDKVKIRKKPSDKSRVSGYLKRGREIEITQVLLGWGKCRLGWIDLYYVQEEN